MVSKPRNEWSAVLSQLVLAGVSLHAAVSSVQVNILTFTNYVDPCTRKKMMGGRGGWDSLTVPNSFLFKSGCF